MTIEEKVESALMDLESLILDGVPVEEGLTEAAETYGLKPDVLRRRAAPSGDISMFVSKVIEADADLKLRATIDAVAEDFVANQMAWYIRTPELQARLRASLESALGRPPTAFEMSLANDSKEAAQRRRQERNLQEMLRAIRSSDGDSEQGSYASN